jgi:hypothetical protein
MVWDPRGEAHQALATAVAEQGLSALSQPSRLDNLLKDLLPDLPREASLLVAAAEVNMARLLTDRIESGVDPGTAIRLSAATLGQGRPFDPSACLWVAREFAIALGLEEGTAADSGWPTGPTPNPAGPPPDSTGLTSNPTGPLPVQDLRPLPQWPAPLEFPTAAFPPADPLAENGPPPRAAFGDTAPAVPQGPVDVFPGTIPVGRGAEPPTARPLAPGSAGTPPPPPRRSRRGLIIALSVVAVLIVVIGGGVAAMELNNHGAASTTTITTTSSVGLGTSTTESSGVTTSTSSTVPATPAGLTAIDGYLAQSATARTQVSVAEQGVQNCKEDPGTALTSIQAGLAVRQGIANNLKTIDLSTVPGGTQLLANLTSAINDSVAADQAFVGWVMDVQTANAQGGQGQPAACSQYAADTHWQAANTASVNATSAKTAFVSEWNPLASTYGLTRYPADGF